MADLARLKRKRGLFKFLLHVALAKEAPISVVRTCCTVLVVLSTYRSPLFLELLQSLSVVAKSPKLVAPLLILASCASMMLIASSFVRVICASLQLDGRLESLCLTSRCDALILPSC